MAQKMSKNVTLVSQRSNVMYLSGTQNPKFSKIRRALSKNSTTKELLKCIEIGLTKAYIKATTVADTRNSCPQQNPQY